MPTRTDHEIPTERLALLEGVVHRIGPVDPLHAQALLAVDRARFVRPSDRAVAWVDTPLALPTDDPEAAATISAPHAYMLGFGALGLGRGHRYLELGSGSGYGAALAAHVVGSGGSVETIEYDSVLAALAAATLRSMELPAPVVCVRGDAMKAFDAVARADRIWITFAVVEVPPAMQAAMAEGAVLVAPVGSGPEDQRLLRFEKRNGLIDVDDFGGVRFVPARG